MRYSKNMNMLSPDENQKLSSFKVAVIGCGGLGGYVIEMLARLGIGEIRCFDGDVFDESNLNRQILSNEKNIGLSKAGQAVKRVAQINSTIRIKAYESHFIDQLELIGDCDLIIDAVDQVETKIKLQAIGESLNIPLIYGAIAGWYGQVSTIYPKDRLLDHIYKSKKTIESEVGNPSFTPATIASIQVSEALKVLLNKGETLRHQLLFIDLLNHDYEILDFS